MSDEKRARDILAAWVTENPDVPPTPPRAQVALVEALAAALAEERRKARAPFLGLADELDLIPIDHMEHRRFVRKTADRIRRAAEESGE